MQTNRPTGFFDGKFRHILIDVYGLCGNALLRPFSIPMTLFIIFSTIFPYILDMEIGDAFYRNALESEGEKLPNGNAIIRINGDGEPTTIINILIF